MALYYIALQGKNNVYPVQAGGLKTVIINLLIRCLQCTPGKEEDVMEMRAVSCFPRLQMDRLFYTFWFCTKIHIILPISLNSEMTPEHCIFN